MSDEANAPSNGAGEVIAPAETAAPAATPVESSQPQAPAKSAREALERSFDSVDGAKEAADPGERPRNPDGTFATKAKDALKVEQPKAEAQPTPDKPKRTPPSRFAREAQEVWEQTPEAVQAEVERAFNELTQGLEKYKGELAPLKPFAEQAKAQGTTIDKLFEGYVSWENAFKRNPVEAFVHILNNAGINPASVLQESVLNGQAIQPQQQPAPNMEPLFNEVNALKQQLAEMQQRPVVEQVQSFAKEHPFFDLLQNDIAETLRGQNEAGETPDLQKAYDAALAKYPDLAAVVAAKKAETATPAQPETPPASTPKTPEAHTRKANLSITGSPSGSDPASRKPAGSPREALERAAAQFTL